MIKHFKSRRSETRSRSRNRHFEQNRVNIESMVYINIPYYVENDRLDRDTVIKEIQALSINEDAKYEAFEAIYNRKPHGVSFDEKGLSEAVQLEDVLRKLGIAYRQSEKSER